MPGTLAQVLSAAIFLPALCAGLFVVITVYEHERKHIERNILALSNLNLATSSFSGNELDKMLGQALERVLNVVRLQWRAMPLLWRRGPNSVVVRGLSDTFPAEMKKSGLDKYTVDLASRLGGLIHLLNLNDDSEYHALSKEEPFRAWRKLLLQQRLQTVIGISLQAKQKAFGLLLLGTSQNRVFSPSELKLLMGLGHQIGMAVENSFLVQQTSRRSEELHILNEIGRALSSTLDLDSLLEPSIPKCGA